MKKIILLLIPLISPLEGSQTFSYTELISQHTPEKISTISTALLGGIVQKDQESIKFVQDEPFQYPLVHIIKDVPVISNDRETSLSLEISYPHYLANRYNELLVDLAFKYQNTSIVQTTIYYNKENCTADGSLYWQLPPNFKNPIKADVALTLRDTIFKILAVKRYYLYDNSWDKVIFSNFNNKHRLFLKVLGVYMYGHTYYESKGYVPNLTGEFLSNYCEAKKLLYDLSWQVAYKNLKNNYSTTYPYHIQTLQSVLPDAKRLGEVVLRLYKDARGNNEKHFKLLLWLYEKCLSNYPGKTEHSSNIRNAQFLIANHIGFYKDIR